MFANSPKGRIKSVRSARKEGEGLGLSELISALPPDNKAQFESLKAAGNDAFNKKNFQEAINKYTSAIEVGHKANLHIIYSNRSACYFKLGQFDKALEDADSCIQLNPNFAKGYFRAAQAFEGKELLEEALKMYQAAAMLDPENNDIREKGEAVFKKLLGKKKVSAVELSGDLAESEKITRDKLMETQAKFQDHMLQNGLREEDIARMAQEHANDHRFQMMGFLLAYSSQEDTFEYKNKYHLAYEMSMVLATLAQLVTLLGFADLFENEISAVHDFYEQWVKQADAIPPDALNPPANPEQTEPELPSEPAPAEEYEELKKVKMAFKVKLSACMQVIMGTLMRASGVNL